MHTLAEKYLHAKYGKNYDISNVIDKGSFIEINYSYVFDGSPRKYSSTDVSVWDMIEFLYEESLNR